MLKAEKSRYSSGKAVYKVFLIMIIIAAGFTNLYAQSGKVDIIIKQPPPNQLGVGDMWNLELNNTSGKDIKIYLTGTATEEKDGLIIEGKSKVFTLKPGRSNFKYNDFSSAEVKYNNGKYKEIILRTGNAPEGRYTICVTAFDESGTEVGRENCIMQNVVQIGGITLITPGDGEEVNPEQPIMFTWTPLQGAKEYTLKLYKGKNSETSEQIISFRKPFYEKETPYAWFSGPEKWDILWDDDDIGKIVVIVATGESTSEPVELKITKPSKDDFIKEKITEEFVFDIKSYKFEFLEKIDFDGRTTVNNAKYLELSFSDSVKYDGLKIRFPDFFNIQKDLIGNEIVINNADERRISLPHWIRRKIELQTNTKSLLKGIIIKSKLKDLPKKVRENSVERIYLINYTQKRFVDSTEPGSDGTFHFINTGNFGNENDELSIMTQAYTGGIPVGGNPFPTSYCCPFLDEWNCPIKLELIPSDKHYWNPQPIEDDDCKLQRHIFHSSSNQDFSGNSEDILMVFSDIRKSGINLIPREYQIVSSSFDPKTMTATVKGNVTFIGEIAKFEFQGYLRSVKVTPATHDNVQILVGPPCNCTFPPCPCDNWVPITNPSRK